MKLNQLLAGLWIVIGAMLIIEAVAPGAHAMFGGGVAIVTGMIVAGAASIFGGVWQLRR